MAAAAAAAPAVRQLQPHSSYTKTPLPPQLSTQNIGSGFRRRPAPHRSKSCRSLSPPPPPPPPSPAAAAASGLRNCVATMVDPKFCGAGGGGIGRRHRRRRRSAFSDKAVEVGVERGGALRCRSEPTCLRSEVVPSL